MAAGEESAVLRRQLSTVSLSSSARQQYSVGQVCEIGCRCFTRGNRPFQQLEAPLLKGGVPIGVLREQPGSMRSFLSMLTPLGTAPPDASVVLVPFAPPPMTTILDFTWTDGTEEMAGGGPVGTVVSETITPAQYSYPLGLGASFQAEADATPRLLDVYVQGFNTRMQLTATLSGGDSATLLASDAAVTLVPDANNNYFSAGIFSILYAGDGETLTVNLTADNQVGIPTDPPQYVFPNAGVFAATVAQVISGKGYQECAVWETVHRQERDAANEQERQLREGTEPHLDKVRQRMRLGAVGVRSAWILF